MRWQREGIEKRNGIVAEQPHFCHIFVRFFLKKEEQSRRVDASGWPPVIFLILFFFIFFFLILFSNYVQKFDKISKPLAMLLARFEEELQMLTLLADFVGSELQIHRIACFCFLVFKYMNIIMFFLKKKMSMALPEITFFLRN